MSDDWRLDAACRGHEDPDLWHAPVGDRESISAALAVCRTCPVTDECGAARTSSMSGIWGGWLDIGDDYRAQKAARRSMPRHGTARGHSRHLREGTAPCDACVEGRNVADNARQVRSVYAEIDRNLAPCGTESAERRHRRLGEPIDGACREAARAANARRRNERQGKPA